MKKLKLVYFLVGILAAFQAWAFQPFTIQRIRVEGLHRVSEGAVLNELPVRAGQTITEAEGSEAIRCLYQTGFFKDVNLSRDGNTLVVRVVERPSISKLTITGIKDKDKVNKVVRDAGLCEGRMYDPTIIARAQREVEKYYFSKGKYGVKVEATVTEDCPGLMNVCLSIYEGDMARIKQIRIVGNCAFKESELIKDFHSSRTNWLSWFTDDDQYAKEKLQADLETLRSYYMDRGYIQFQIDSTQVSLTPDKKCIYITIHVTEGDKYTFGNINYSGPCMIPEERIRKLICPLQRGCTFSRKDVLEVRQSIEDALGDQGYSMASIQPTHVVNEACKEIDITYQINPNRRVYVRRIMIAGNLTTQDEVLRREIPQLEGTWVSSCLLKEGKERIQRRGYASEIEIETQGVPGTTDQVDVLYKIQEARMGQIGAGLGYSASERLMFNFSISQENFLGTGKIVDFTFDKSKSASNYAFGYQDPYFTVDGIGMGVSAYYNKANLSKTTQVSNYITDTMGAQMRWVFPLSKYESFSTSIGYDNTHIRINPFLSPLEVKSFIQKYGNKLPEWVLGFIYRYDSLDQRIFPTRGLMQSLGFSISMPGSNQKYYKASYEMAWFYPICDSTRWIFNLSGTLGYGNGYGNTPTLPFYRNYFAGGTRFVRGFEENSLGPRDSLGRALGGNALVAGTAALIFPNPIKPDAKSVRTALFLDAGQVYDTRNQVVVINGQTISHRVNGMRYSVGVSLTWHSPLGAPLTFSLAKPLNPKPGDLTRTFTFWMGTQF